LLFFRIFFSFFSFFISQIVNLSKLF
jgi:hypothetical protein